MANPEVDEATRNAIVDQTARIREVLDGFKAEFDAKAAGVDERIERMEQARTAAATEEHIKALVAELVQISKKDQSNRHVDLVPTVDYSVRAARRAMEEAQTPAQVREVYDFMLSTRPVDDKVKRFQELSLQLSVIGSALNQQIPGQPWQVTWHPAKARTLQAKLLWYEYETLRKELFGEEILKRAFPADTADAPEWIPSLMSAELLKYLEVTGTLLPNIRTVPMPTSTYKYPITAGIDKARRWGESTVYKGYPTAGIQGQNALYESVDPIGGITLSAKKLRGHFGFSTEFEEESIVSVAAFAAQEVAASILRGIEDAMINGDSDSPELDSDLTLQPDGTDGSYSNRTAWKGFREFARANSTTVDGLGASITATALFSTLRKMGRYALQPSNSIWLFGLKSYLDVLDTNEFITLDRAGNRATLVTGSVGLIAGRNVIVHEYVREDLATTGRYTGTGTTTEVILFDKTRYILGNFRGMTSERERFAWWDQSMMYCWWRGDFQKTVKATEPTEACLVNLPI